MWNCRVIAAMLFRATHARECAFCGVGYPQKVLVWGWTWWQTSRLAPLKCSGTTPKLWPWKKTQVRTIALASWYDCLWTRNVSCCILTRQVHPQRGHSRPPSKAKKGSMEVFIPSPPPTMSTSILYDSMIDSGCWCCDYWGFQDAWESLQPNCVCVPIIKHFSISQWFSTAFYELWASILFIKIEMQFTTPPWIGMGQDALKSLPPWASSMAERSLAWFSWKVGGFQWISTDPWWVTWRNWV